MARFSIRITFTLIVLVLLAARLLAAAEASSTDYSLGDTVPLGEVDLRDITLQVLEKNPVLSSSPGIKFSSAQRSVRSTDIADIIYYPHAVSAGIRQALQVQCWRQMPDKNWTCDEAEIRRYLQLETQVFEVRVTGDIGYDSALALIHATRGTVQASATDDAVIPKTAILILPKGSDRYLVTWGSPEGYQEIAVEAYLSDEGNPAEPEDWQTSIYEWKDH